MSLPKARVVPTAVLAKGGFQRTEPGLSGFDQPLQSGDGAFSPSTGKSESDELPGRTGSSAAPPARLYELGLTTAAMGFHTAAIEALQECVARAPDHAPAWRKLGELLRLAKRDAEAEDAGAAAVRTAASAGKWSSAAHDRTPDQPEKAERKLQDGQQGNAPEAAIAALCDHLIANPTDAAAMRLLAQLEAISGDAITCLRLLERALDICPDYLGARRNYAELLVERRDHAGAAIQTARLLADAPREPYYRNLHAHAMVHTGNLDAAIEILAGLLREYPGEPGYWLSYAQALHFMGRRNESVQAYRHCLALRPVSGEAYWGLADLKGNYITESDVAAMRAQLEENALEPDDRMHMLYALGQALERAGDFPASFAAYDEGAKLVGAVAEQRRSGADASNADASDQESTSRVRRMKKVFSRENLQKKLRHGPVTATHATPIFIVGMPRAGSTLVEQILASHSRVEGTRELPLIGDITRELALSRMLVVPNAYPECILDLTRDQLAALGARYIDRAAAYRKTERPWFIDKRPWNWLDAGLIHLMLPHARIIDIRREPMAACFAMFKQLLPIEASFSYNLDTLGRYYNKYVSMMEHWESIMPGRIHFVQYERLIENTEIEVRRMLDYCGLPFEEGCLRFWETERAIATPSAEQVRRPIFRDALQQWRSFEPWLGPLKESLNRPLEA